MIKIHRRGLKSGLDSFLFRIFISLGAEPEKKLQTYVGYL